MRARAIAAQLASVILTVSVAEAQVKTAVLSGFTVAHSERERVLEKQFMAVPDAAKAEANLQVLTADPHLAGSPADHRNAEFVLAQFRSFGLDAEIEEFPVLVSEPKEIKLDILGPVKFSGPNPESVPEDPASTDSNTTVGFNAYSASGDVTGQVVYANYGLPEDYDVLRANGVSPEGKIVIVRYGNAYRGAKALVAEEHKAAALIIYSDPQDDGYHAGETYPNGPWRPASGVQRGSALYDFIYPGTLQDRSTVPHIPVMPLSYEDARHILEPLSGGVVPGAWQGGLPFTYHYGPGPVVARVHVQMHEVTRPIWNVIAKVRGGGVPEELVVLGNHRDAWVYGAADPNSGTAAMLEVARGLGALLRGGWRPQRTIILCSWDAEEQGELGSTHWAEKNAAELGEKAVAYLNLDVAVGGDRFSADAVPSLKAFVREVAADVPDPKGGSVWDRASRHLREELRQEVRPGHVPASGDFSKSIDEQEAHVGDLGSGSDYVTFFDHLGIPSTDFSFGGEYGVYHSIFDNYRWMKQFGDPTFGYHRAAAQLYGLEALRLAGADVLPFDYEIYGVDIQHHLSDVANKLALLGETSQLDFQPARKSAEGLAQVGRDLLRRRATLLSGHPSEHDLYALDRILVTAETGFLVPAGLPRRPWFRHAIFAPGFYNGYAAEPLPGLLETIDAGNFDEARRQLKSLTDAIQRVVGTLNRAQQENRPPGPSG
jgi:N-acetylated-alpha-linked acidic dipeptidase